MTSDLTAAMQAVTSAIAGYSPDWVSEAGLDLEEGFCITLVRGVGPRGALRRLGVGDAALRTATWLEFTAQLRERELSRDIPVAVAAFVMGEYTVLVEDFGYRGQLPEWAGPVSRGSEAVNVYRSPISLKEELSIFRDGEQVAFIDGDEPDLVEGDDAELAGRLAKQTFDARKLRNGRVDLLQVACGYLGLRPEVPDVSGPVLGALAEYR